MALPLSAERTLLPCATPETGRARTEGWAKSPAPWGRFGRCQSFALAKGRQFGSKGWARSRLSSHASRTGVVGQNLWSQSAGQERSISSVIPFSLLAIHKYEQSLTFFYSLPEVATDVRIDPRKTPTQARARVSYDAILAKIIRREPLRRRATEVPETEKARQRGPLIKSGADHLPLASWSRISSRTSSSDGPVSTSGAISSGFSAADLTRLTILTSMKTTKAMIRKLMTAMMKAP